MIVESSPTMTDGFKYGNDKIMADIFFLGSVRGCSGERSENRRLRLVEGAQDAAAAEDPASHILSEKKSFFPKKN